MLSKHLIPPTTFTRTLDQNIPSLNRKILLNTVKGGKIKKTCDKNGRKDQKKKLLYAVKRTDIFHSNSYNRRVEKAAQRDLLMVCGARNFHPG